jgi:membrane protease YdiL (CAAX protease family)
MNPQEVVALTAGGVFIIFGGFALLVALVEEVLFRLWKKR